MVAKNGINQYLHEVSYNNLLVTNEIMGLCVYMPLCPTYLLFLLGLISGAPWASKAGVCADVFTNV